MPSKEPFCKELVKAKKRRKEAIFDHHVYY